MMSFLCSISFLVCVSLFAYFPTSLSKNHHCGVAPTRLLKLIWKGISDEIEFGINGRWKVIDITFAFVLVLGGGSPGWNERYLPTHKAPIGPDISLPLLSQISVLWIFIIQEGFSYELIAFKDKGETCSRRWQLLSSVVENSISSEQWYECLLPYPHLKGKCLHLNLKLLRNAIATPGKGRCAPKLSMESVQSVPHRHWGKTWAPKRTELVSI